MSWIPRSVIRAGLAASVALALLGLTATTASAVDENVKYYTVTTSFDGSPENLAEIATRFLGSGYRSFEVFNLNTGRDQPDGSALTDPAKLHAGWMLILPWDAVGAGVQYGLLPDKAPKTAVSPSTGAKPSASKSATPSSKSSGSPSSSASTGPASVPTKPPKNGNGKGTKGCASASSSSSKSDWATLRLAPDQAWTTTKGSGQLVAVVDSGADGSLPALTAHIAQGMDIVGGSGRGDTDCLGTGTAMAGLIAAQAGSGGPTGLAPGSTVMPVKIVDKNTKAKTKDAASAITAAVAAGATVVALGSYVDTNDTGVAKAVHEAVGHDVVVVLGASLSSVPVNADADSQIGAGVLRVAGIGVDQQPAADYRKGGIDVVAPGVNINGLGITGAGLTSRSGTQYAVSYVAAAAALVRSAFPDLSAAQVAHRVEATAETVDGSAVPNGAVGYGLISLASSVTKVLPEEAEGLAGSKKTGGSSPGPSGSTALLAIVMLVALAAAVLLVFRIRRLMREDPEDDGEDDSITGGPTQPQPQKTGVTTG